MKGRVSWWFLVVTVRVCWFTLLWFVGFCRMERCSSERETFVAKQGAKSWCWVREEIRSHDVVVWHGEEAGGKLIAETLPRHNTQQEPTWFVLASFFFCSLLAVSLCFWTVCVWAVRCLLLMDTSFVVRPRRRAIGRNWTKTDDSSGEEKNSAGLRRIAGHSEEEKHSSDRRSRSDSFWASALSVRARARVFARASGALLASCSCLRAPLSYLRSSLGIRTLRHDVCGQEKHR